MYFGAFIRAEQTRDADLPGKLLQWGYNHITTDDLSLAAKAYAAGLTVRAIYVRNVDAAAVEAVCRKFPEAEIMVDYPAVMEAEKCLPQIPSGKLTVLADRDITETVAALGGDVKIAADVSALTAAGVDAEAFLWRNGEKISDVLYTNPVDDAVTVGRFQFARYYGVAQTVLYDGDMQTKRNTLQFMNQRRDHSVSILNLLDTQTGEIRELHRFDRVIEAPNWLKDGDTLLYNSNGRIFRYSISADWEEMIESGVCDNCNNDHVPSVDNKWLAVSHQDPVEQKSLIYILPIEGGEPVRVTPKGHSFLHGWSVNGELAYCAFRQGGWEIADIYTIRPEGGEEICLTGADSFSDGPEYSPDGEHIWFNSTRSGLMQAWRMDKDGKNPVQMTDAEANNWFPHISPDNQKVVYLCYRKGDLEPGEHLPNMQVSLWYMQADGSGKRKLLDFFGGQGSINVNSWAPDSRWIAFVSYELNHR